MPASPWWHSAAATSSTPGENTSRPWRCGNAMAPAARSRRSCWGGSGPWPRSGATWRTPPASGARCSVGRVTTAIAPQPPLGPWRDSPVWLPRRATRSGPRCCWARPRRRAARRRYRCRLATAWTSTEPPPRRARRWGRSASPARGPMGRRCRFERPSRSPSSRSPRRPDRSGPRARLAWSVRDAQGDRRADLGRLAGGPGGSQDRGDGGGEYEERDVHPRDREAYAGALQLLVVAEQQIAGDDGQDGAEQDPLEGDERALGEERPLDRARLEAEGAEHPDG